MLRASRNRRTTTRRRTTEREAAAELFNNAFPPSPPHANPPTVPPVAAAPPAAINEAAIADTTNARNLPSPASSPPSSDDEEDPTPNANQPRRQARRAQTLSEQYFPPLREFMSWRNRRDYPRRGYTFTREQLEPITADEYYRWNKFKIYDDPDADETILPPVNYRVNTVMGWKKAVSSFMVNSHMEWNEVAQIGNPTRSQQMAKLLKNMRRFQTQRRGRENQATRGLTDGEFTRLIETYWTHPNRELGLFAAAHHTVQFQMIGRNDDICKLRMQELTAYNAFPQYGICARLVWSKNVREERDAPTQIILPAMNTLYDAHSNLGLWLEYEYELHGTEMNDFLFGYMGLDCPIRIKDQISRLMNRTVNHHDFITEETGKLGTHSIRKCAATYARSNGCSKVSWFVMFCLLWNSC